jgi:chaperone required for assembly of F1-ATPase
MKRFYELVTVLSTSEGHSILLDGKPIKTPARTLLQLPTRALAEAIVTEWDMQGETIDAKTMPLTRHANTVLDRITAHRAHVIKELAAYGESDLICYRASGPADLVVLQSEAWDPLIEWAKQQFGVQLAITASINHVPQVPQAVAKLTAAVETHSNWQLAALHEAVTLSGSLVIGLALAHGRLTADEAWAAGQLDELFQASRWGEDADAATVRLNRRAALDVAARLFHLLTLN